MNTVFVVVYSWWDEFELQEVFQTRELAEKYLEGDRVMEMITKQKYNANGFRILEKIVWGEV